jgi:hypothetical protein
MLTVACLFRAVSVYPGGYWSVEETCRQRGRGVWDFLTAPAWPQPLTGASYRRC